MRLASLRAVWLRHAPLSFLRFGAPDTAELGRVGEELAARHVYRLGWQILGRRVLVEAAEIDLVCRAADDLVCVEVKTGRAVALPRPRGGHAPLGDVWRPVERYGADQRQRQQRAARQIARRVPFVPRGIRVDTVEILLHGSGRIELVHDRAARADATDT